MVFRCFTILLPIYGDKTGTVMASFEQRESGWWQAKVRRKGHATQSRTFEKKVDAEAWARDIENKMDRGIFEDRREAETTTLRTALERYEREITSKKKAQRQEKPLGHTPFRLVAWCRCHE